MRILRLTISFSVSCLLILTFQGSGSAQQKRLKRIVPGASTTRSATPASPTVQRPVEAGLVQAEITPGPCLYITPGNSNGPIPNQSELPERPRSIINSQIARVIANIFDDDDSIPDNFYQVLTPNGEGCRARVEQRCSEELRETITLPATGGEMTPVNCAREGYGAGGEVSYLGLKFWCLDGPYRNYFGETRGQGTIFWRDRGSVIAFDQGYLYHSPNGGFVLYATNDPETDDLTVVLRAMRGGIPASANYVVRKVGSPHIIRNIDWIGDLYLSLDVGTYDVTATEIGGSWRGTRRVEVRSDVSNYNLVELDTAPVVTARVEPEVYTVARPEGIDFPQVEGQLCDPEDRPLDFSGTLTVQGISQYHDSEFQVIDGKYTLFGLRRGSYLLRFSTGKFYVEQIFDIPFKMLSSMRPIEINFNPPSGSRKFRRKKSISPSTP